MVMRVFPRDFEPGAWYIFQAYSDGSDGWYVGPFASEEEARAYRASDNPEAVTIRVFRAEDPEL